MCTASWICEDGGYRLFFNRDEKRTRRQAAPPRLSTRESVRFLAPSDGDFGGTWIAVNEFGVSLCLLNGANLTGMALTDIGMPAARSRGLLLPDLISSSTAIAACQRALAVELSSFAPFTLVALEAGREPSLVEWNGGRKTFAPEGDWHMPLTSSSFEAAAVRRERRGEFVRILGASARPDADLLIRFHRSHGRARGAFSPCMHRDDAETVSFSRIRVTASEVSFLYEPAAPCMRTSPLSAVMPRRLPSKALPPGETAADRLSGSVSVRI